MNYPQPISDVTQVISEISSELLITLSIMASFVCVKLHS